MARQPTHASRAAWPAWLVLIAAAAAGLLWWWQIGRPVAIPDAVSTKISCVSYGPYRLPGQVPYDESTFIPPQQIEQDLAALSKRVDCVRTYSQSQGLSAVPEIAARHGMKVLMGIWLGGAAKRNEQELALGIATAKKHPQVLRGIVVGNEVLLRGELSPQSLAGYIRRVHEAVPDIPVTYADVWEFWLRYPQMASVVNFATIHILPYWEDRPVPTEHAIQHVAEVYARMQKTFPGKPIMIGETGWPSAGRPRRAARASLIDETRYLRGFLGYAASVNLPYNVFEAFDELWKRRPEGTVGGYWGIYDTNVQPKVSMRGPVVEEPRWLDGWYAGLAGLALFALAGAWRRPWRGVGGWLALGLAGIASGTALAWQYRQMYFACRAPWEWAFAGLACLLALYTALRLARQLAAWLAGDGGEAGPDARLRFGWMAALTVYGLLMVFDGRYRDFPLGLIALPAIGFLLAGWLDRRPDPPLLEERFLAFWLPALAAVTVIQEIGLNPSTWLWLGFNLALAVPVVLARRLLAQQA